MNIAPEDILKVFAIPFSAGGGYAFFRPFAARLFTLWLDRMAARQKAEEERARAALDKERALERIAVIHERTVGVLENVLERLDRLDARQDRVEAHLGIPLTSSAVPAPPPQAQRPRTITSPEIQDAPRPVTPSSPGAAIG
jgi:hypothetical protein